MRTIVAIGGEPGTGKTTLLRKFMKSHTWVPVEPEKLVSAMYCEELNLYVLGKYEQGEVFAGTDRLSMAVQPQVVKFLENNPDADVIFEGDRIFNQSFLEYLVEESDSQVSIIFLQAKQETLNERYEERGSNQSEKFLKGRKTKYQNLMTNFTLMPYSLTFVNETEEDQEKLLNFLKSKFYTIGM